MINLPLDGLMQLLANAKATGILYAHEEIGDRMRKQTFYFIDGMLCGRIGVLRRSVSEYIERADLEWRWMGGPDWRFNEARHNVEAVLLECARLADERKETS